MITIALSALAGALLAWRFRAFVLVPTTILVLLATALVDAGAPLRFIDMFAHMFSAGTALQLGYLAGALLWGALHKHTSSTMDVEETTTHRNGVGSLLSLVANTISGGTASA